jgi:hypothetical protein
MVRMAARLVRRGPAVTLRQWRKQRLRADYQRGRGNAARDLQGEETDSAIVGAGTMLRQQLFAANERKHAASGYRVLMLRPGSITAEIWFRDLQSCMRFAGIECRVLPPDTGTSAINAAIEAFEPNVFVATESCEALTAIDLSFLHRYKRRHGCLRLFVPVWHSKAPGVYSTPEQDEWRRRLRWNGLTADAHFSLFDEEFHQRFSRDPQGPDIDYVAIPQACNPFTDFPMTAVKRHDYIMATSMTDDRVAVAYSFLRPILARYRGLWAGPRWGFGVAAGILPEDMALHYAQSRIALSPLVEFVHRHSAELTHRVYAAAGCGTFQLTMPTAITHRFFRADELVQAGSPAEYARMFDHFVDRPLERNAVALAALRRAYGEHTFFHRIDKLVHHWDRWRERGLF